MRSTNQHTIVGIFEDRHAAEKAVSDLHAAGFGETDVGYAIRGSDAVAGGTITDAGLTKDKSGLATGMAAGAVGGSILGALAALALPGVGPVVAAGILSTALGFGAAGTAVGGLIGAFTGLGISESEAREFEREFNAGRGLVTVRSGDQDSKARYILQRNGAINIHHEPVDPIEIVQEHV